MAGMLAGVESARRRRIHQSIVWSSSSSSSSGPGSGPSLRPPGACLCSRRCSSSLFFANPSSPSMARSRTDQADEKLGQLAREAKERLDERLRLGAQVQSHSHVTSHKGEGRKAREEEERRQNKKKKKKKKKGWGANAMCKLRSAGNGTDKQRGQSESESESECAICLEELGSHEKVVKLDCSHTFHSLCLLPWLHSHSLCPCCRTSILSFSSS